jgi:ligand-binding sensor domain-containing protein/signal transduction histidine kinase
MKIRGVPERKVLFFSTDSECAISGFPLRSLHARGAFKQLIMRMRMKSWALAAVCCLLGNGLTAAGTALDAHVRTNSAFIVNVWTTENGLPQNEVTCLLQTRDGYLWLGTPKGGLVRFDGIRFTVFDEGNTPGLTSSKITSLFEDGQGNLWVGTGNGVVLIKDGKVLSLGIGKGSRDGQLAGICQDPAGAVWLYLANGQLWRYQNGATNMFLVGADQPTDYRGLILEPSGPLWVGTDLGMFGIDWRAATKTGTLVDQTNALDTLNFLLASRQGGYWRLAGRVEKWKNKSDRPELNWGWYPWDLTRTRVCTACEDQQGNLVVGTRPVAGTRGGGVYWFDANGDVTHLCSTNQNLSSDYVSALLVDRDGDLWVGTDGGGLDRVKRPVFDVLEPTRDLVVQSAAEDQEGGLWIGCNAGLLSHWKDNVFSQARLPARTVFVDRQQRVWAGTWGAGLWQVGTNGLTNVAGLDRTLQLSLQFVSALYQDRRGWLWVGTQRGLARWDEHDWKTFTTRDGLSADSVLAIASDAEGNLWAGTEGGGLDRWRNGQFTVYRKQEDGLPSDNISALYVDDQDMLWIGTDGAGLARLRHGKWTRYTRQDGLLSNSIGYIIEDGQGYLWMGSISGLMRAPKQALNDFADGKIRFISCQVYGQPDGLPIRECSSGIQPGPCRTRAGKLLFPTIKGLAMVDPAELKPNPIPPPVRIDSVLIDGKPQQENLPRPGPPRPVVVPAGKEEIEIQFSSLNLSAPGGIRFRHRLIGHETDWIEGGDTSVVYTKLPPAHYRFQVSACNQDGVWNDTGATLLLSVTPPLWRTWWFLSAASIALLASITGIVHYLSTQKLQRQLLRLRQQEALEKERSRIARDIHDQLGANLTQVALLGELVESDKDAPHEVEAHARQISNTARETTRVLDEIVWAVNPANDTLDGLMTYICKYSQEYLAVAGLHYRLDVPGQLPAASIPPEIRHNVFLACKEAVTNVVRHSHASAVWVRLRLEPGAFVLEIEDNGRGLAGLDEKAAATRNGLRNMRKRMEDVGGEFGFAPAPEGGALVRLTAPLGSEPGLKEAYVYNSLHRGRQ